MKALEPRPASAGGGGRPLTWSPFGPAAPPGPWQREGSASEEVQGPEWGVGHRGPWERAPPRSRAPAVSQGRQGIAPRGCLTGLFGWGVARNTSDHADSWHWGP